MIGNVSPGLLSCEHTLNTLRYSDRVKELKRGGNKDVGNPLMLPRQNGVILKGSNCEEPRAMNLLYKKSGEEGKIKSKGILSPQNGQVYGVSKEQMIQKHAGVIQEILEKEEELIIAHQKSIGEMPDIMNYENQLINDVQEPESDIDEYLKKLEHVLEYRESIIKDIRTKVAGLKHSLKEEQTLNSKIGSRRQEMDVFDLDNDDFFENMPLY